jgi:hypothetical protein
MVVSEFYGFVNGLIERDGEQAYFQSISGGCVELWWLF